MELLLRILAGGFAIFCGAELRPYGPAGETFWALLEALCSLCFSSSSFLRKIIKNKTQLPQKKEGRFFFPMEIHKAWVAKLPWRGGGSVLEYCLKGFRLRVLQLSVLKGII